jgi:predicted ArsR family transcriptional regulator
MEENKYLLISLEDEKAKHLAEVLSSKTAKKIINLLAEESELSEKDISDKLEIPINTVEYNLKKLLQANIIEKTKKFFWSPKGRKIDLYQLSNKSIIIAPKGADISKFKSLLPAFIVAGIGTIGIKIFTGSEKVLQTAKLEYVAQDTLLEAAPRAMDSSASIIQTLPAWAWFLTGSLIIILIFYLTKLKGGKQ